MVLIRNARLLLRWPAMCVVAGALAWTHSAAGQATTPPDAGAPAAAGQAGPDAPGTAGKEAAPTEEAAPAEEPKQRKPLMQLMESAGLAEGMDAIGLNVFGWVETSFTGIFTGPGGSRAGLPLRVYESRKPDNLKMNQLAVILERAYDRGKDFDIGFRMDPIFGSDSRLNASVGLLDHETHTHSFDLAQLYTQLWFKTAEDQGLELTFGKWYTTVGAEVIPSPLNWLPTRTMLFGYGPFTHTGLLARYYIDNWNIHLGVSRGWDQWKDNNHGASWHAGFGWDSKELCDESPRDKVSFAYIGGPEEVLNEYGGQNRHIWNVVWTHKWTEKLTQVIDSYYTWEDDVQGVTGGRGVDLRRDSAWYGLAYMMNYKFNDCLNATGRFEWFGDNHGARTGFDGNFYSLTTGLGYTPFPEDRWLSGLLIRPELRWDFSANNDPFVKDRDQFTGTISVVYAF